MKIKTFKYCSLILMVWVTIFTLPANLIAQKQVHTNTSEIIVIEDDDIGCAGEEPLIYFIPDKMPEFPGGGMELRKYIATHVKYPNISDCAIEGKVYIRFCVTDSGNIEKINVIRGVDPLLDKEAVRVVKSMPKWQAGEQGGKKVNVWYTVPVSFRLE